jgi:hypothetical protein
MGLEASSRAASASGQCILNTGAAHKRASEEHHGCAIGAATAKTALARFVSLSERRMRRPESIVKVRPLNGPQLC